MLLYVIANSYDSREGHRDSIENFAFRERNANV
jgi:hypothetical protein